MTAEPLLELLSRVKQGDQDAIQELVHDELPRVYNLCLRLCRRPADAEDLCQDVFVNALRSLKSFKGDSAVSTWLYRITVNAWKNRIRHDHRRHQNVHVSINSWDADDERPAIDLRDTRLTPEQQMEANESRIVLMKALELLGPEEKFIVILRDIEQKSYEEISKIMDLKVGTVKSRLARARDHLRELFERRREKRV